MSLKKNDQKAELIVWLLESLKLNMKQQINSFKKVITLYGDFEKV